MSGPSQLALALLAGCLVACGPPDFSRRFPAEAPPPGEIEGVFVLEEQTLARRADFRPAVDPELRLLAGGRFEARGFPLWRREAKRWRADREIDAIGIWRIVPHGERWGVSLTAPVGRVAMLGRHEDRWQLIFFYGDRESRQAMVFTRR